MDEGFNRPPQSKLTSTDSKSKVGVLGSIMLGLLTFIVTGIIALAVLSVFYFFGLASENLNPVVIVSKIFGLSGLGGFFGAQFILILILALVGDLGTAFISWCIHHSKKLAIVTFFSALIFQIITVAVIVPTVVKKSAESINAGIESEQSFEKYALIGDVSFETQQPFSESRGINGELVQVSLYKKLSIVIPVSVSHAGLYQVSVEYGDREVGTIPMKNNIHFLHVGENLVNVEFLSNESKEYGYLSPSSVGGIAQVQLGYLASSKELLDTLKSDGMVDEKILQQFIKDEGIDTLANSNPNVYKFVGRKEVKF